MLVAINVEGQVAATLKERIPSAIQLKHQTAPQDPRKRTPKGERGPPIRSFALLRPARAEPKAPRC